jgi:hypothetical protein
MESDKNKIITNVTAIFYTALYLIAQLWAYLTENRFLFSFQPLDRFFECVILTALLVIATVAFSAYSVRTFSWARALEDEFYNVFANIKQSTIFIIALFSGIGEEFLFRGAMQAHLGYVYASLMFGLIHIGPNKRFLPWTFFAVVMGFALGGLYRYSDNLLCPVVAHFAINYLNISGIAKRKR